VQFQKQNLKFFFWGGVQTPLSKITTWQATVYNP